MKTALMKYRVEILALVLGATMVAYGCRSDESKSLRRLPVNAASDQNGGNEQTPEDVGGTGFDNAASIAAFKESVYPLMKDGCNSCHAEAVSPYIAHEDAQKAHDAIIDNKKVDFFEIANSRIILRLKTDNHNCPADCEADATKMSEAVQKWVDKLVEAGFTPTGMSHDLQTPKLAINSGTAIANVIPPDVVLATADQATNLVAPLTMASDDGDGQAKSYLSTPAGTALQAAGGTTGTATFTVNIPTQGTWFLWGRVKTANDTSNEGYFRMDNGATTTWVAAETGAEWAWDQPKVNNNPLQFANLAAGSHTVQFKYREGGMKLSAIFLTTNAGFTGGGLLDQYYDLKFSLKEASGKNATLIASIAKFESMGAIIKNLRIETDSDITIKDIRPLVNGKFNPKDAAYRSYSGTIKAPGGPLYDKANSMPIILENGFDKDQISFSFGTLE